MERKSPQTGRDLRGGGLVGVGVGGGREGTGGRQVGGECVCVCV